MNPRQEETSWRGVVIVPGYHREGQGWGAEYDVIDGKQVIASFPDRDDAQAYLDAMVRLELLDAEVA